MTIRTDYELTGRNPSAKALTLVQRELTVTDGTTTTTITDSRIGAQTQPALFPADTEAAGIFASVYLSDRARGSITLTHDAPGGDAVFLLSLIG